jgi:hypothetical protein
MLGRKDFTAEEIAHARAAVDEQLGAYRELAEAVDKAGEPAVAAALEALEPALFGAALMALDRFFVHRLRTVARTDANPLTEVELLVESLMAGGVLRTAKGIKYAPDAAVLQLAPGDRIRLTADRFARLADAFLAELQVRFAAR